LSEQPTLAPPGIFKAYDIRGLYGSEMDETTAHAIGRAFARVLARLRGKQPAELRVGLGRDMRLTAPEMAAEVRDGMISVSEAPDGELEAGPIDEVISHNVDRIKMDIEGAEILP